MQKRLKKGKCGKIFEEKYERYADKGYGLLFFDNYLEGTGYSAGRADYFTLAAPPGAGAALFLSNHRYNIPVQHQDITGTHADTQATAVALIFIYYGHISQCHSSILYFSLVLKSTVCM
jgi:hypothetical protein